MEEHTNGASGPSQSTPSGSARKRKLPAGSKTPKTMQTPSADTDGKLAAAGDTPAASDSPASSDGVVGTTPSRRRVGSVDVPIEHEDSKAPTASSGLSPMKASLAIAGHHRPGGEAPGKDFQVLSADELKPLDHPEPQMQNALTGLKSDMWDSRYKAIEIVRRLAAHHPATLYPHIAAIIPVVLIEGDSLRSAIARNALMCLCELAVHLKQRSLVAPEDTVGLLLRKSAADKSFLREAATAALDNLAAHAASHQLLLALCGLAGDKNATVTAKSAQYAEQTLAQLTQAPSGAELTVLVQAIGRYHASKAAEARNTAKRILAKLADTVGQAELEEVVTSVIGGSDAATLVTELKKKSRAGAARPSSGVTGSLRSRMAATRRPTSAN